MEIRPVGGADTRRLSIVVVSRSTGCDVGTMTCVCFVCVCGVYTMYSREVEHSRLELGSLPETVQGRDDETGVQLLNNLTGDSRHRVTTDAPITTL